MASTAGPTVRPVESRYVDEDRGYGWVVFAGSMLLLVGILNIVYGIAAIDNSRFYAREVTYVITDLSTYGWVMLVIGAIQALSAFGIWARAAGARWVGILTAGVNAIVQLLVISGQPWLAVTLFTIDVLIIYGLLAHGRRPS